MSPPHLFILLLLVYSIPTPTAITLPLSQLHTTTPQTIYTLLHRLASSSLYRATTSSTPLHPHSYGGYSITLSFGTPPQPIPFVFDTGSNLMWFPCTHHYICNNNCSLPLHSFLPKLSSSARILGCHNPKCKWVHSAPVCPSQPQPLCPPYILFYGSGTTAGLAILETLELPNHHRVPDFLVGCSLFSSSQPAGIAGFGRGPSSLPSQLNLSRFSFCLISHKFDDSPKTSKLRLITDDSGAQKTAGVAYTPFLQNPIIPGQARLSVYYYVMLRRITVGGKNVKIPYEYLSGPDPSSGSGGTIVDSGTTFTYMRKGVYGPLVEEFVRQAEGYKRNKSVEEMSGLGPCFDLNDKTVSFPSIVFHFKGGAEMELGVSNLMALIGDAACLTIVSDGAVEEAGGGPAVLLGNFQMQNFYVEFDLQNQRFGFMKQNCG